MAEKGGSNPGDRSLARRSHDQNTRRRRWPGTPYRLRNNRRAARRRSLRQAAAGTLPSARLCLADTAYDADKLRKFLIERGTTPVIPNNPTRKRIQPFDPVAYKQRNLVERMFCRLKDWRRVATRYDKLAAIFASAVFIAAIIIWWT